MKMRKLLICSSPRNEIEIGLQRMYLRRVREMFKRAITMESTFNIFDEVFHGIAQTSSISENLHSFYEAFLTITQYYQHSQAGRGSLVAKLLEELGTSERMKFEFVLTRLPQFLGQQISLEETELTKQKFDIANKSKNNLVLCELKMKVYSGCSAGRIELMEKFNKFVKLVVGNEPFRICLKNGGIKRIYLVGGVLFDIEGNPATTQKDEEWGICYNGLTRAKNDIIRTLKDRSITYSIDEKKLPEKAFIISFSIDKIDLKIVAVYGNEVIRKLFIGKQTRDIGYFKQQLEGMLYDDLWLGQIITLSERAILDQNFKNYKRLDNFITAIMSNNSIKTEIERFRNTRNENILAEVTQQIINALETSNIELSKIKLIPAELMIKFSGEEYSLKDYIADIVQFLSCEPVMRSLT
jgi:hypothetical protein